MTLPDESDAERAANRRDNRRGAIVAGAGLVVVLVVGGIINLSASPHTADTARVKHVELPTPLKHRP